MNAEIGVVNAGIGIVNGQIAARSLREVVQSLGVSLGVVTGALKRAAAAGLLGA